MTISGLILMCRYMADNALNLAFGFFIPKTIAITRWNNDCIGQQHRILIQINIPRHQQVQWIES